MQTQPQRHSHLHPGLILKEKFMGSLTQKELAEALDVSGSQISNLVKGRSSMTLELAIKLATYFPRTEAKYWMDLQCEHDLEMAVFTGMKDRICSQVSLPLNGVQQYAMNLG